MLDYLSYIISAHFELATHALLLFLTGLFVAFAVTRYRIEPLRFIPLHIYRVVLRLIGDNPSFFRMAAIIWVFNSTSMFICIASGIHPMLPKILGLWTGINVGVIAMSVGKDEDLQNNFSSGGDNVWRPPRFLAMICGLLVFVLELPAFWYSVAMGISMGHAVQSGTAYGGAFRERIIPYLTVIVPVLLISAIAESITIRSATPSKPGEK